MRRKYLMNNKKLLELFKQIIFIFPFDKFILFQLNTDEFVDGKKNTFLFFMKYEDIFRNISKYSMVIFQLEYQFFLICFSYEFNNNIPRNVLLRQRKAFKKI